MIYGTYRVKAKWVSIEAYRAMCHLGWWVSFFLQALLALYCCIKRVDKCAQSLPFATLFSRLLKTIDIFEHQKPTGLANVSPDMCAPPRIPWNPESSSSDIKSAHIYLSLY
jgi:hypothetical protein